MGGADDPIADERAQVRQGYRAHLAEYKSVNAELSDLSWTLSELEQQIVSLAAEYVASQAPDLERRLRHLRRWKESLEENILRRMYRAEELTSALSELRRALANLPAEDV